MYNVRGPVTPVMYVTYPVTYYPLSEGLLPSEADDIFLFQRLISLKNYHINVGNLDYMTSV